MNTESLWTNLPIELKLEIFGRIPWANKFTTSLVDLKRLVSLKIICKDWNFVISRFCAPRLCPPNPRARVQGFLYSVEDDSSDGSDSDDDYYYYPPVDPNRKKRASEFKKWLYAYGKDSDNGNNFEFRCHAESRLNADRIRIQVEKRILSLIPGKDLEIRDCCNGMILFASSNHQYYVGNPVTRQRCHIPASPNTSTSPRSALVFDPSVLVGNENQEPHFKIVSFGEATVSDLVKVDIFSSENGEWCTSAVHISEPHDLYGGFVYFNRALYSLSTAMHLVCIENIIAASPDLRAWAVALPDKDEKPSHFGCIGNCYGSFYYSNLDVQGSSISVWMLGRSEWSLIHSISIREDIGHCTATTLELKMCCESVMQFYKKYIVSGPRVILPNDDGMTLYIGTGRSFITYNVDTKISTLLQARKKIKRDGNMFFPFTPCPLLLPSKRRKICYEN